MSTTAASMCVRLSLPWDTADRLACHSFGPFFFGVFLDAILYGVVGTHAFLHFTTYKRYAPARSSVTGSLSERALQGPAVGQGYRESSS